jgi:hypothetical protein
MGKALTVVLGKPARDPIGALGSGRGACSCTSACPYGYTLLEILVRYLEVWTMFTSNL